MSQLKIDPVVRTVFRTVAVTEAITWALLLAAMFAKYVTESEPFGIHEGGVPVAGALHGGVFVLFVAATLVAWRRFGWSFMTLVAALISAVVPFATYAFEISAERRGLLGRPARVSSS